MSLATDWAALVATSITDAALLEDERPPELVVGGTVFSVNRQGGLNVSAPSSSDFSIEEIETIGAWIQATFIA